MVFSKGFMAVAVLGASVVDAHIKMIQPTPYNEDTLTKGPMNPDGSNFPCKISPGAYEAPAESNNMKIGELQTLKLMGSAVHGGGSCQVSLTTDMHPTKDSEWMVIKSIMGGCPAKAEGNLPGSIQSNVNSFDFTIPDGIEPGKYTLAWTWFNRIGNREMYMNCAPINVEGGSAKRSEPDSKAISKRYEFPGLFVANINGCTTEHGVDVRFPNPGGVVEFLGDLANLISEDASPCTGTPSWVAGDGHGSNTGGGSSSDGGSGSGSGDDASSPTSTVPSPTSTPSFSVSVTAEVTPVPQPTDGPGIFAPGSSSQAPEPSTPTPEPSPKPSPEPSPPSGSDSSSTGSGSSSSSSGALNGPCTSEGFWNCIGGTSFQRCASGLWSEPQPMAPGTKCNAGQSQELTISATRYTRRSSQEMRRKRSHGHIHA
ncbi:hypothetical protein PHISP_07621 [Aspergillus sp. HF37]|nr:hypothetical protein PHISP_07621 [Aspergillus sp. HF37]